MSSGLLTLVIVLAVLFVHEMGHALAAWALGVKVREVLLGLGPKLLSFKVRGLGVSLRLLPLGAGVDIDDEDFQAATLGRRLTLLLAGSGGNLLGAFTAMAWLGWLWSQGKGFLHAFGFASTTTTQVVAATVKGLVGGPVDVVGPIGLAHIVGRLGPASLELGLVVFACLSIGVGVFNLIPVVPLDGGRVLVELFGNSVSAATRQRIEVAGAIALGGLAGVIVLADLVGLLH